MKKKYSTPKIDLWILKLEDSISAGSATARFIGPVASESPDVEPWNFNATDLNSEHSSVENW